LYIRCAWNDVHMMNLSVNCNCFLSSPTIRHPAPPTNVTCDRLTVWFFCKHRVQCIRQYIVRIVILNFKKSKINMNNNSTYSIQFLKNLNRRSRFIRMANNKFRYSIVKLIFRHQSVMKSASQRYKNKNPLQVYHDILARLFCNDK